MMNVRGRLVHSNESVWGILGSVETDLSTLLKQMEMSDQLPIKRKRTSTIEEPVVQSTLSNDQIDAEIASTDSAVVSVPDSVPINHRETFVRYLQLRDRYVACADMEGWFKLGAKYTIISDATKGRDWCRICNLPVKMGSKHSQHVREFHPMLYNVVQILNYTYGEKKEKYILVQDPPGADSFNRVFFNVPCSCVFCMKHKC